MTRPYLDNVSHIHQANRHTPGVSQLRHALMCVLDIVGSNVSFILREEWDGSTNNVETQFDIILLHKFVQNNCRDKCHVVVFQIIGLCRLGYLVESSQSNTCGGASVVGRMQHPLIFGIFAQNKFFLIFPIAGESKQKRY